MAPQNSQKVLFFLECQDTSFWTFNWIQDGYRLIINSSYDVHSSSWKKWLHFWFPFKQKPQILSLQQKLGASFLNKMTFRFWGGLFFCRGRSKRRETREHRPSPWKLFSRTVPEVRGGSSYDAVGQVRLGIIQRDPSFLGIKLDANVSTHLFLGGCICINIMYMSMYIYVVVLFFSFLPIPGEMIQFDFHIFLIWVSSTTNQMKWDPSFWGSKLMQIYGHFEGVLLW